MIDKRIWVYEDIDKDQYIDIEYKPDGAKIGIGSKSGEVGFFIM